MNILEELKAREVELLAELGPVSERYQRLTTELAMVRYGIRTLALKPCSGRVRKARLPDELLDQARAMRADRVPWAEVALRVGTTRDAIQKAVERREKGNPHLRKNDQVAIPDKSEARS